MLLTGLEWCDFVVCAQEDMLVEQIYKDLDLMHTIRDRADHFFLLPLCTEVFAVSHSNGLGHSTFQ